MIALLALCFEAPLAKITSVCPHLDMGGLNMPDYRVSVGKDCLAQGADKLPSLRISHSQFTKSASTLFLAEVDIKQFCKEQGLLEQGLLEEQLGQLVLIMVVLMDVYRPVVSALESFLTIATRVGLYLEV
jgi:hypothetical protein